MADRPTLRTLADRLGILPSYIGVDGRVHSTSNDTREALVRAMGYDGSTEATAQKSLEVLDRVDDDGGVNPVRVLTVTVGAPPTLGFRLPADQERPRAIELVWHDEGGWKRRFNLRSIPDGPGGRGFAVRLPILPGPGYHRVVLNWDSASGATEKEQLVIVAPSVCCDAKWRMPDTRGFGVLANLYAVAGERNWGVGDFGDVREIIATASRHGADFVGLNPLHSLRNVGHDICPYTPLSRLFHNPLYIEMEQVPELDDCQEARTLLSSSESVALLARLRSSPYVNYDDVYALKKRVLRLLHTAFGSTHEQADTPRGRAYRAFLREQGDALRHHAVFLALTDHFQTPMWRRWPAAFRNPHAGDVMSLAVECRDEVSFQMFLQFETERQLASLADAARTARMGIGLYLDLALGSSDAGSDSWMYPDLFVHEVRVGAPPDPYSDTGQTWGFPPLHPRRLAASRYDYWIRMLRASMAHAGMIRIDHVMGLFRQFWVPDGRTAVDGAYVLYPAEELLGILALESQRHGVVVVGEDLGTVPPEVPESMRRKRMLSSRVIWFERDETNGFRPADAIPSEALTTVTTHDHPPLRGLLTSHDLVIRRRTGLIADDNEANQLAAERRAALADLARRLRLEGLLSDNASPTFEEFCTAIHVFAARTPSLLAGLYLDDLSGEVEPVNIPGVPVSRYPSWSRRMTVTLDSLLSDQRVLALLDEVRNSRRG